jgi:ABC-type amino acid transport substrate-binding protein
MQRRLQYFIGFSQAHTDKKLVDQFNATLVDLYRRGVAQAILKTYNMEPVTLNDMKGTGGGNK